jgi:hypothetical protein
MAGHFPSQGAIGCPFWGKNDDRLVLRAFSFHNSLN